MSQDFENPFLTKFYLELFPKFALEVGYPQISFLQFRDPPILSGISIWSTAGRMLYLQERVKYQTNQ